MKKRIKHFLHYLYISIKRPEMEVLPGNLAFFFMMMIIPLLTIMGIVISNIDVGQASVYDALMANFPPNIASMIISISGDSSSSIGLWALFTTSLLLASNGTYSMIVASNSIYGIKKSNYLINKIKSIILLIILIILFVILLFVPIFNNKLFEFIGSLTKTDIATNAYVALYHILKYPVTFLLVFIFINVLYKFSPSDRKKRRTTYGAIFASILLVIVTWGYSNYLEFFSDFENYYGGISNILCLMFYLNIIAYIFVLGMSMNYARDHYHDEREKERLKEEKESNEKIQESAKKSI